MHTKWTNTLKHSADQSLFGGKQLTLNNAYTLQAFRTVSYKVHINNSSIKSTVQNGDNNAKVDPALATLGLHI